MADTVIRPACICGHPASEKPWEWAPGQQSVPLCVCCMRRIWEETLANVTQALADYPIPEGCGIAWTLP